MPICKKCDQKFKNYVIVDGKTRNVSRRKYCLDCSPFGQHNTRQLEKAKKRREPKECPICGREHFYKSKICSGCKVKGTREEIRGRIYNATGKECWICGYNKSLRGLEFHHVNPDEKNFTISSAISQRQLSQIVNELLKCILICANCHAEIHDGVYNNQILIELLKSQWGERKSDLLENFRKKRKPNPPEQKCEICGVLTYNVKYCSYECSSIGRRITTRPPKEQLEKELQEDNYVQIGRKYGVSDNTIRKWLK